jgi:hypothetical protein
MVIAAWLLVLVPIALGVHFLMYAGPLWTFVAAIVAIVPLAPSGSAAAPSRSRGAPGRPSVFATDEPADERKAAWPLWRSRATAKRRGSKGCC